MKPKTNSIIYWIATVIFAVFMIFSAISPYFDRQSVIDVMAHLGYPAYLLVILGVAKVLGSIALLQNKWKVLKEWAYAGFTFDIVGAGISIGIVDGVLAALAVLPFLVVLAVSYWFWKKKEKV